MKYLKWLVGMAGLLLQSCFSSPADMLTGTWQMDSTYYYYNGFDYTSTNNLQKESYQYSPDGIVKVKTFQDQLFFHFLVQDTLLAYTDGEGKLTNQYAILKMNEHQLVLKKDKAPVFKGAHQQRYEIRYFSKINEE